MLKYCGKKAQIGPCRVFVVDNEQNIKENLRHIVRHSPDGFQWSYGGSGPSDLSLSILHDFCSRNGMDIALVDKCYQSFKRDFVATAGDNLEITGEQISDWFKNKGITT